MSDVTFDMRRRNVVIHQTNAEPWSVTLVDTGEVTATGGRLRRVASYLGDEDFCFTYGDGVGDIDIGALRAFHRDKGTLATVTAVHPPGRFGVLTMARDKIAAFKEKPQEGAGWINGGYFVLSPKVIEYVTGDDIAWEREPMERLAGEGQLSAYMHGGFWQPLDTLRDRNLLNDLWNSGQAPWKKWQ
jgi:glucose-1-phosphate cytidylyltransferase